MDAVLRGRRRARGGIASGLIRSPACMVPFLSSFSVAGPPHIDGDGDQKSLKKHFREE